MFCLGEMHLKKDTDQKWMIKDKTANSEHNIIESESGSVVSDSLLYSPWNSPGQNTGVVAFSFSKGSSQPRDQTQVSRIAGRFFTSWATREALRLCRQEQLTGEAPNSNCLTPSLLGPLEISCFYHLTFWKLA